MEISWHEKQAVFKKRIKFSQPVTITGSVEFMVCNDRKCLPPTEEEFSVSVAGVGLADGQTTMESVVAGDIESQSSAPTLLVIDADGKILLRSIGYVDARQLIAFGGNAWKKATIRRAENPMKWNSYNIFYALVAGHR